MPIDPLALKRLFQQAMMMADRQERTAWLVRECGDNAELLAKLQALLAARDDPDTFLERLAPLQQEHTGAFTPSEDSLKSIPLPSTEEKPGHVVGRYKLLECIGEGGMGSVWMAEQREPVKRLVALKLIKAGMDTQAVLTRFEAERQALALMDHPNIAKVLDGGTTESGRPFFVMELVKGLPLTEYCDSRKLNVKDRLQLFIQICSAVQHAHQKGIIHRDLKPSNVLVTEHDGLPVPKVIDFGLAKALLATNMLTDRTMHTAYGTVVGTPLYMAPEQVGINALDTDTRSDIYALGVLLYELLTGTTPLEKQRFKEAAWDEVKRIIQEEEPPRPSLRLSSSDTLPSLAANRQVEPAKLSNLIKGELDWIVMKALEKDRNRRYETANGFSRDIQRYLANEMVEARPPSVGYRVRKFVQRNKGPVLAASLILLALVGGILGTTWGLIEAKAAGIAERKAKEAAETRQSETQAVLDFIEGKIFDTAKPIGLAGGLGYDVTLRKAVEAALPFVDKGFTDKPLIEARLRNKIGKMFYDLDDMKLAAEQFKAALTLNSMYRGPDHRDTLRSKYGVAICLAKQDKVDESMKLLDEILEIQNVKFGLNDRDTLNTMNSLSVCYSRLNRMSDAINLQEKTLTIQKSVLERITNPSSAIWISMAN